MTVFNFISLFGGLALFLYGMRIMGEGLQQSSSGAMKKAMEKVTNNPFIGFLLGLVVTAVIQSSTATIVLTSGLVGAGILTLKQSIGIIIGANVGTTVTGQIIRLLDINASAASWLNVFKPSTLAPIAAVVGIVLIMLIKSKNSDLVGTIAMGFGILFTGLLNMTAAVSPLSESEAFAALFLSLSDKPVLGFLAGAVVAFAIQSSSATIGILQALSVTGALSFSSIYSIIIGIYLGDCVTTAIVCSIGAHADAKRTGVIHIMFNLSEAVLVLLGVTLLHKFGVLNAIWSVPITSGGIANTHTVFNLICALILLPVCGQYEKLSRRLVKDDKVPVTESTALIDQLDEKFFASPALALSAIRDAMIAMATMAHESVKDGMDALRNYNAKTIDKINNKEAQIDALCDAVDNYLIKLSPHIQTEDGNTMLNYYIQCLSEIERIGDYAVNLAESAEEIHTQENTHFSDEAKQELNLLEEIITEILDRAEAAFCSLDMEAARHIEPIEEVIDDMVATLRKNHIRRLREGRCTVYTGIVFLDILVNAERIADQCSNIGIYTLSQNDLAVMKNHHDYTQWLHQGGDELFNEEYANTRKDYFDRLKAISAESE